MRVPRTVGKFLSTFTGSRSPNPVNIVPQRFLQAFRDHGIEPPQIPRLLPRINLNALQSEEALLPNLAPEILDSVAHLFGIRTEWLEGVDDKVYEYKAYHKEPGVLLDHLAALVEGKEICLTFPLRILTVTKQLDRNDRGCGYMAPVLLEKITDLGEETIYRYHVYQDGIDWSHSSARIELKAIARLAATKLGIVIPLHVITNKEMEGVLAGKIIPRRFLEGCQITDPSLEDYVLNKAESVVAKEFDELPAVFDYIEKHGLSDIQFHTATEDEQTPPHQHDLPPLDYEPDVRNLAQDKASAKPKASEGSDWKDSARTIADELDARDAAGGAYSSVRDIAKRVAVEMRSREIYGPRGPLSEGTILRDALQGKQWKRKQLKR